MNVFKTFQEFLNPLPASQTSEEFEIPLGLTGAEWKRLKAIRADDDWDVYLKALDEVCRLYGEALLGASTDENLHFQRGLITGIREAATLVDKLKRAEDEHLNERKRRTRPERAGHTSALYGSPGWRRPDTSGVGRSQ